MKHLPQRSCSGPCAIRAGVRLCLALLTAGLIGGAGAVRAENEAVQPGFSRAVSLGLNMTDGNSKTLLMTGGAHVHSDQTNYEFRLSADGAYGEDRTPDTTDTSDPAATEPASKVTAQNATVAANYKRIRTDLTYFLLNGTYFHDDIADILYRVNYGPGVGLFFVRNDRVHFSSDVGLSHVLERLRDSGSDSSFALRLSEAYSHKLSESAKLEQTTEFLPQTDDLSLYLLNTDVVLETVITRSLNLRVRVLHKYDSQPADTKQHADVTFSTALSYSF